MMTTKATTKRPAKIHCPVENIHLKLVDKSRFFRFEYQQTICNFEYCLLIIDLEKET